MWFGGGLPGVTLFDEPGGEAANHPPSPVAVPPI